MDLGKFTSPGPDPVMTRSTSTRFWLVTSSSGPTESLPKWPCGHTQDWWWQHPGDHLPRIWCSWDHVPPAPGPMKTWARFLSLVQSKLRLCSANHRPGYWCNQPCDWPSTAWAYSEQETENGPRSRSTSCWLVPSSSGPVEPVMPRIDNDNIQVQVPRWSVPWTGAQVQVTMTPGTWFELLLGTPWWSQHTQWFHYGILQGRLKGAPGNSGSTVLTGKLLI